MTNPFDDHSARFHVLANSEKQFSLWPTAIPTPDGWSVALHDRTHAECTAYVETHWTDLRPASLIRAMEGSGATREQA
ncbi:MbtH family protein [Streptomyces sp. AS58]|uniref:Mbth protein n=1 Tax=Streptomyces sp. MMG1662 TaxID=1415548 RepID=U5YQZ5_9ACTN|nr:MbtH family protein [Streptomyces sp. AS58]AGZ94016.1 mbth protein [Streptomyces sp. MMG1662]